jgi:DNA-binding NtrC family response regulator
MNEQHRGEFPGLRRRLREARETLNQRAVRADGRPRRVLLAEDDADMRRLLAQALRDDGYDVLEARNGSQLLDSIAALALEPDCDEPVDMIISDLRMPGRNGLSILAGLRDAQWMTPFILITAFGDDDTHAEAHRLGASAVFDKPFDVDDLRTAVLNMVPHAP